MPLVDIPFESADAVCVTGLQCVSEYCSEPRLVNFCI